MPIFELCINLTHIYTMVFKVSIFIIHAYLICIVLYLSTTVFYCILQAHHDSVYTFSLWQTFEQLQLSH